MVSPVVCALTSISSKIICSLSELKKVRSICAPRHTQDSIFRLMRAITSQFMLLSGTGITQELSCPAQLIGPLKCGICKSKDQSWHSTSDTLLEILNGLLTPQPSLQPLHQPVCSTFGICIRKSTLSYVSIWRWRRLRPFMLPLTLLIQSSWLVTKEVVSTHSNSVILSELVHLFTKYQKKKEKRKLKTQYIHQHNNWKKKRWKNSWIHWISTSIEIT